jgi:hypothetical protein
MICFCLHPSSSSYAEVVFRQANSSDLKNILATYRTYSEEDRKTLVTYPEEIDESILRLDLTEKKIFLSENDKDHKLLAVLKLFIIKKSDLENILHTELRTVGAERRQIFAERLDSNLSNDRKRFLENAIPIKLNSNQSQFELNQKRQLYIYYGGAYTIPELRGTGLQTQLLYRALHHIEPDLIRFLQAHSYKKQLIYTYGQVDSNTRNKGMIQVFTDFTRNLIYSFYPNFESKKQLFLSGPVYHLGFFVYKPSFHFNHEEQKLDITFPEDGKGMSNLVILRQKRK